MLKKTGGIGADGSRLRLGNAQETAPAKAPKTQHADAAPSASASVSSVEQLANDERLAAASRAAAKAGAALTMDFSASPLGADAAAKLFLGELSRFNPADIVAMTQYVAALGVQVGYEGTPLSHFTGLTHQLARVPFPESPAPALLPAFKRVQELSAETKQIAIKLRNDQSPQNLREYKTRAVFIAHELAEVWRRAPSFDGGRDLQKGALQALKNVADLQGRVQFAMQDFVENTKRGMGLPTEGAQPLLDPKDGELLFRNSLRLGRVELDPAVRQQELDAKYQKSLKKGVKPTEIEFISPQFLAKAPHGGRFEYVLVTQKDKGKADELRVTLNEGAGHSMLAGIDPRLAAQFDEKSQLEDNYGRIAGGGRILRADDGGVIVLGDPKSGHYRAPTQQADHLVPHIAGAGVPRENIIMTPGDPLDTGEVLAIDVWVYKAANNNQLPKEIGDKFFSDSVALQQEAVGHGAKAADALFAGVAKKGATHG
jgi:hypothetical protein